MQYIYEKFEGTTWYIQKICNELFAMSDPHSNCGLEEVDIAIKCAVEEKNDIYQDIMARLSSRQKILLLALAHSHGNVQPTSGAFIKKFNLTSASSVQRNLMALQEKDIITNSSGQYRIYDYFLNFWLNKE